MSTAIGIRSFGAYIPARRMQRSEIAKAHAWALPGLRGLGKGEKAFCSWDEDVITMAVEASRDCMRGQDVNALARLCLASTSAPFADVQNATLVASALGAPRNVATSDQTASTRAGLSALSHTCESGASQLLVAGEKRRTKLGSAQEMLFGDGAAALLLGSGDDLLATYLGSESLSVPFVDHFRESNSDYEYAWEERWIRDEGVGKLVPEAVNALLRRLGKTAADVAHFGLAGGGPRADGFAAKKIGIADAAVLPDLRNNVGDTGAAHSLLLLTEALERAQAGDLIIIAAFAQGCEVIAFEMGVKGSDTGRRGLAGNLARRHEETAYMKMLSFSGEIEVEWGMRSETDQKTALTQQYRVADQTFEFVGGKCRDCDTIQFPRLPNCVNCGAFDTQSPAPLADEKAKVLTVTADWLMFSQSPPLYMGLSQFDNGARMLMEIVDVGPEGIDVGTPLEMTFRIKELDKMRGYRRYFWKARPIVSAAGE
ncbi:MAG: 3-hydroxy-3-methylglutaryl CoA synthase [Zhongshania aliphaticivorans]|jgi:3-hydroxy-3-methylglutaryl CoA synthase|uniref:zinc ribbon domain-containing protein n=1 Tax=Zhongshania aliphaticivorans TaxID=1470434 RepID=UPI0039E3D2FE